MLLMTKIVKKVTVHVITSDSILFVPHSQHPRFQFLFHSRGLMTPALTTSPRVKVWKSHPNTTISRTVHDQATKHAAAIS